jgi:hypothetical protein
MQDVLPKKQRVNSSAAEEVPAAAPPVHPAPDQAERVPLQPNNSSSEDTKEAPVDGGNENAMQGESAFVKDPGQQAPILQVKEVPHDDVAAPTAAM